MTGLTTASEKTARMAALGYIPARADGKCCLCGRPIHAGQYIGKLPDGWEPENRLRHAHHRCVDELRGQVRAKAARLGIPVPSGETP